MSPTSASISTVDQPITPTAQNAIKISVVIPVRNEQETITQLLDSIALQTRQPDEVLLVDGGSEDGTIELVREACGRHSWLRLIEAGSATPGRGRNLGIAAARYDWIALTDAGITLAPTWLAQLLDVVERDAEVDIVYGNYEPVTEFFFARCGALLYAAPKQQRAGGWMRGPSIASALLRRTVWERTGGFPDLRAAEDWIFMERVEERKFKVGWAPRALVWWQPQPTLRGTFRRFVVFSRYNVWAGRQRYWHYGLARTYVISLLFCGLALLHNPWWLVAPLLILLARTARSIWQRRERRGLRWLSNPIQFFGVATLLVTIDVASFVGWLQALRQPAKEGLNAS